MKSNRMRETLSANRKLKRLQRAWSPSQLHRMAGGSVDLRQMPAPGEVQKIDPDQIIEDILVATLLKVQGKASPAVAAASARYISLLRAKAL